MEYFPAFVPGVAQDMVQQINAVWLTWKLGNLPE